MLILVRHGESEANAKNIVRGQMDFDLTPEGVKQAREAGENLRQNEFDYVFRSQLKRSIRTCECIMSLNKFAQKSDCKALAVLNERRDGSIEGIPYDDLRKNMAPKSYKVWQRDYFEAPPDGESMADLAERLKPFLHQTIYPLMEQNKNILVVRHGDVMRIILGDLKQMDEDEIMALKVENAMPYVFRGSPPTFA